MDAERGHVEGGARAVLGDARVRAAFARDGVGERAHAAGGLPRQRALQRPGELHAEGLAAAAHVVHVRDGAELHRALYPSVRGVILGRGSDVSLDRDDDVGRLARDYTQTHPRRPARLRDDAQVDRYLAVVQPAAAVVAQVVHDAAHDVLPLGVRDWHRSRVSLKWEAAGPTNFSRPT